MTQYKKISKEENELLFRALMAAIEQLAGDQLVTGTHTAGELRMIALMLRRLCGFSREEAKQVTSEVTYSEYQLILLLDIIAERLNTI